MITTEQAQAISRGELKFVNGRLIPTDSGQPVAGGLVMHEAIDDSGRKIRTFANSGNRKVWMDDFRGISYLQQRINHAGAKDSNRIVPQPENM